MKHDLTGPQVHLSPIAREDTEYFWSLSQEEEILKYLPDWRMTLTYAAHLVDASAKSAFLCPAEQPILLGVYQDKRLCGAFFMGPEWRLQYRIAVGFWIGRQARGNRLALKALQCGETLARKADIKNLYALTQVTNHAAITTLSHAGYRSVEHLSFCPEGSRDKKDFFLFEKNETDRMQNNRITL